MDELVSVDVDLASVYQSSAGGTTYGVITVVGPDWVYPSDKWSDFIIRVLVQFLAAFEHITSRVDASARCDFMDGPYGVRLTSTSATHWLIECMSEKGIGARYSAEVTAQLFACNVSSVAARVLNECKKNGFTSPEIEALSSLLVESQ
jgi:hypothetical protein